MPKVVCFQHPFSKILRYQSCLMFWAFFTTIHFKWGSLLPNISNSSKCTTIRRMVKQQPIVMQVRFHFLLFSLLYTHQPGSSTPGRWLKKPPIGSSCNLTKRLLCPRAFSQSTLFKDHWFAFNARTNKYIWCLLPSSRPYKYFRFHYLLSPWSELASRLWRQREKGDATPENVSIYLSLNIGKNKKGWCPSRDWTCV